MRNSQSLLAALLFLAGGVMLTVIQAPIDASVLAWAAMVPFAAACMPQMKPRRVALIAYAVGVVYWLVNLYWIVPITVIGWVALCLYMAVLWPLLAMAIRFCRTKGLPLFLAMPVLVVGAERMQGFPLGGFYWRFLGHSQYANLAVIQIADLFGAAGVSFVVAMVNGLGADLLLYVAGRWGRLKPCGLDAAAGRVGTGRRSGKIVVVGIGVTSIVVAGTLLYGRWRIRQSSACVTEGPTVAALQSNVPISVKRSFQAGEEIFKELMGRSVEAAAAGAELIVWPETMVQGILRPELWPYIEPFPEQAQAFHQALSEHAQGTAYLLVGAYGAEILRDFEGQYYLGDYNSAYLYRPDGSIDPNRYDKIHLVLFGEYIPFRKRFNWLYQQLRKFTPKEYNYDYSLEHGTHYTVFEMVDPNAAEADAHRFAVIICYEDTIPYVPRNFALDEHGRKRIDWLVNISNDGWFVRFLEAPPRVIPSAELPQHAAICAFRAVENRLPILRSVNTGVSCLIDSCGRIHDGYRAAGDAFPSEAMQRTGIAGWFVDKMPIDTRVSFYSRHGEWLAGGCALAFVAAVVGPLGARLVHHRLRRRRAAGP